MSKDRNYEGKYRADRITNPVYKEDSTKGKSLLTNPQTFKGDALVQVWVDSRILATLSNWLDMNGTNTRFMSEVVNSTLKASVDMLVRQDEVDFINNTLEARELLVSKYRVNLNPRNRGMKNVMHNQLLSNKSKDMNGNLVINNKKSTEIYEGGINRDEVEMARKIIAFKKQTKVVTESKKDNTDEEYELLSEGAFKRANEERKKYKDTELKAAVESMRSQGRLAKESTGGFREGMSDEELREYNEDREKDVIARENAPIDTTGMVFAEEVR